MVSIQEIGNKLKAELEQRNKNLEAKGAKIVSLEDLAKSGVSYGFTFAVGDEIIFPPLDMIAPSWASIGKKQNGEDIEVYSVFVWVNKGFREVPVGSFRRTPLNYTECLKEYPEIIDIIRLGDDLIRVKFLAGKRLKVIKLIPCECTKWKNHVVDGTEKKLIPIFEITELS